MSWFEKVKELLAGTPEVCNAIHAAEGDAGRVLTALRGVNDPELNQDIVHLGMIRAVTVEGGRAKVTMTPTTAGCPLTDWLTNAASDAIRGVGFEPEVELVTDPPWTPADIEG